MMIWITQRQSPVSELHFALEHVQSNWNHAFIQQPEAAIAPAIAFGVLDEFNWIGFAIASHA